MTETDTSPIAKALANIAETRASLDRDALLLRTYRKAINQTLHLLAGYDNAYISTGRYSVAINVDMRKLDGMQAPRLLRVLEKFAGEEWTARTSDYADALLRHFIFHRDLPAVGADDWQTVRLSVTISAYVADDSPTCRKVLVGKKRVVSTRKEYRIECS